VSELLGQANVTATLGGPGTANPGQWTATFTPQVIGISLPEYECYRIIVSGGPMGSTFRIWIGGARMYGTVFPGWDTEWDPNNAMPLVQGDSVEFRWNSAASANGAPDVWMYFRARPVLT
jgi:hypothetical protein